MLKTFMTTRTTYRGVDIPEHLQEKWYAHAGNGLTVGQIFCRGVDQGIERFIQTTVNLGFGEIAYKLTSEFRPEPE
jgi:hypothetical protein